MVVHNSPTTKTRSTSEEEERTSNSKFESSSRQKFEFSSRQNHPGLLQCIECQAGPFSSRSKLLQHLMTHNAKEQQIRCQKCKILHPSILSAQNHICGHPTTTSDDMVSKIIQKKCHFEPFT